MGSSLPLQGGTVLAKTVSETHTQSGHSFTEGDVLRYDVGQSRWVKAQANNAANAEVAGVVSSVISTSSFTIVYSGYIQLPSSFAGQSFPALFLSDSVPGALVSSPPSAIGSVVKPVVIRSSQASSTGHLVVNYLGTQIGGSSTVSIDQIQPVGTIMPFVGNAIPDTWLECSGLSYAVFEYTELYDKLLHLTGDRTPTYGYVSTLTATNLAAAGIAVGDIVQYKNNAATAWQGGFYDSNADQIGTVISVTATTLVVQTIPLYSSATKTFSNPDVAFKNGNATGTLTGASQYRILSSPTAVRAAASVSITGTSITHFNTPDLRGRFVLGTNSSAFSDNAREVDSAFNTAIGQYRLGVFGGEEQHVLSVGELPSHDHTPTVNVTTTNQSGNDGNTGVGDFTTWANPIFNAKYNSTKDPVALSSTTVTVSIQNTGSNTPHNNMPPYLAVRYIIKSKPYTRAAIIDTVDIDFPNLLVTDLRPGLIRGGGVNDPLVFKTNNSLLNSGTERMRISSNGDVGIGTTDLSGAARLVVQQSGGNRGILVQGGTNPHIVASDGSIITKMQTMTGLRGHVGSESNHPFSIITNNIERLTVNNSGFVGIGKSNPSTNLDIVGSLALSGKATSAATITTDPSSTLTTKGYVDGRGVFMLSNSTEVHYSGNLISKGTGRQTVELHPHIPETATYAIITLHLVHIGNIPYMVWVGSSTTVNSGHRFTYATATGNGDVVTTSTQMVLPIHKISETSRRIYYNVSASPQYASDSLMIDVNGYYI